MSFVSCFEVVSMVVDEATERFSPLWRVNGDKIKILNQYCDVLDILSKEFNGVSYEVEVNEITMEIDIALECDEIIIESKDHVFYELIKRSIKYGFSVSEDGALIIKFVFPSVWENV